MIATTVKKPSENSPIKRARRRRCERKQTPQNRARATKGKSWEKTVEDVCLLEKHLDVPLFDRRPRGVRLNRRGQAYLKEVQRILAEVHGVSERQRRCGPAASASSRSRRSPRSGSCPGSPPSRRRTPASRSSWKPTTAASTPTAATSTPGSPIPARPRRGGRGSTAPPRSPARCRRA